MKNRRTFTQKFLLPFLFLFAGMSIAIAQPCANDNVLSGSAPTNMTPVTVNTPVINNGITDGEYVLVDVCLGATYEFSLCGTGGFPDSKLMLYDDNTGTFIEWNDDFCGITGWLSFISWTAPYAGTIRVLVDDVSCINQGTTYQLTVTQVTPCCALPIILVNNVSCNGANDGWVIAIGQGVAPWNYIWYDSTGAVIRTRNGKMTSDTISGLAPGNYSVKVVESSVCDPVEFFTVGEPDPLAVSAITVNDSCGPVNTGSASLSVTGGTAPYSYWWITLATTSAITNVASGSYPYSVTDANGCSVADTAIIGLGYPFGPAGLWTWTGEISVDWFDICNWDKRALPSLLDDVLIPGGTPNEPTIANDTAFCRTIEIMESNGALLTIDILNNGLLFDQP